jgi:hypothetical protein
MQAANYHLTAMPRTPSNLFFPMFVAEITPTQPEEVAGEDLTLKADEDTARERVEKPGGWHKDLHLVLQDDNGERNLVYLYSKDIERARMA